MIAPPPPRRALIVKPSALGDVVTALPVLRGLRRSAPESRIDWLIAEPLAPLLKTQTGLDEAVIFERKRLGRAWRSPSAAGALGRLVRRLRSAKYDWVLDLQGLLRSGLLTRATGAPLRAGFADAREGAPAFYTRRIAPRPPHTVDRNIALARALGIDARPEDLRLEVPPDAAGAVRTMLAERGVAGGYVAAVPPTTWTTKLYPARHWRAVIDRLAARRPVVLAGAPTATERALCAAASEGVDGAFDLSGQTSLPELVALLAGASVVLCCDSAAKFIAQAVGTPPVVLIGPTRPERTGPYARAAAPGVAVVAEVPCTGCLRKRCPHVTCMESIEPGRVVAATERVLEATCR